MIRSKSLPYISGEFVRWVNDEEFLVVVNGKELIGHKDYWEEDFPSMKKTKSIYKVPVVWSAMGYVTVEADSGEDAMKYVKDHLDEFSLPLNGEYLDDSFEVDEEGAAIRVS